MEIDKKRYSPMLLKNEDTGKVETGVFDNETKIFHPVSTVENEEEIKEFMKSYGLGIVFNSLGM